MSRSSVGPNILGNRHRYQKISDISSGSFGFVQLAKDTEAEKEVAIKFLQRRDQDKYLEGEILNHHTLCHPHVVEFKQVFLTRDYICIVEEYANQGSLFDYVRQCGRLRESAARWFFQQQMIAVDYCHRKGVVNRDLKLENTLLHSYNNLPLPLVKLCDFGFSKAVNGSAPKSRVGTMAYMAPEVMTQSASYDGKKADIWSCGVMLYVMLVGQYPFEGGETGMTYMQHLRTVHSRISNQAALFPSGIELSEDVKDLLKKLLTADPDHRMTMQEIFQHPWFLARLPDCALAMNDTFLNSEPQGRQSLQEVKAVIDTARQSASRRRYGYGMSLSFAGADDLLEDSIEVEGSFLL